MIKKLTRLLGNIVGRTKENMSYSMYWLTVAMMGYPLSFVLVFWGIDRKDVGIIAWATVMLIVASTFWGVALYNLRKEHKRESEERRVTNNERRVVLDSIKVICDELRGLRQDLGDKRSEHSNSND